MPVVIVRTNMIDDDGTGTTGTMFNNAWKTEFYNQIDQALAKVPMLTGANTFMGNQAINGLVNVTGLGSHGITGSGVGVQSFGLRNSSPGAGNASQFTIGNDADPNVFVAISYASNFTGSAVPGGIANSSVLYQGGAGLSLTATQRIDLWTNNTRRWTLDAAGHFTTGTAAAGTTFTQLAAPGGLILIGNAGSAAVACINFLNANNVVGQIITSGSATSYNTASDARLKTDRGIARDTSILERTEIHDYEWIADGTPARGVFSQDAHKVAPFANMPGTDERDDEGRLVRPWSTDYSKYIPDLIVGWQQHAAALAAIRAELAALKG
jgi:hypothetical protein